MSSLNFKRTKFACYAAYFTMSSIFCLPPLLFVTLHETFNISWTLLGTLVLTNFCTQLLVDLIFTFFSKKFNVKVIVKIMPLLTSAGLLIYALIPTLFPNVAYLGLLVGTIIFSVAAGFSEVLLSPTIAALPSDNPQRDMSLLHSLYAFGVFTVVVLSTIFIKFVGADKWAYLTMIFAALPVIASVLFMVSPMPDVAGMENASDGVERTKNRVIATALCVACIFFGSCAENAMSNWASSFIEKSIGISKEWGDLIGVAGFAILLGLARITYAKFGKKIAPILLIGMCGAVVCYLVAGLSLHTVPAFIACVFAGLFTSMLWPGTLIYMEEQIPSVGVGAYALMAAGGDLGAAVAPQLMGAVVDGVSATSIAAELGEKFGITAEQIGLKAGMLTTAIFPVLGIIVVLTMMWYFKKHKLSNPEQPKLLQD